MPRSASVSSSINDDRCAGNKKWSHLRQGKELFGRCLQLHLHALLVGTGQIGHGIFDADPRPTGHALVALRLPQGILHSLLSPVARVRVRPIL